MLTQTYSSQHLSPSSTNSISHFNHLKSTVNSIFFKLKTFFDATCSIQLFNWIERTKMVSKRLESSGEGFDVIQNWRCKVQRPQLMWFIWILLQDVNN